MKKTILVIAAVFSFAVIVTSCKDVKKEDVKTEKHNDHNTDAKKRIAAKVTFQCPMNCEKGKTYDEAGTCPICKMDLKANKATCSKCESGKGECKKGTDKCEHAGVAKKDCKPGACADKK